MPTDKAPAFQFYPGDWLRDTELAMATPEARGIWIDLLCRMWFSAERGVLRGTIDQLALLARGDYPAFVRFLSEAKALKFCDVSDDCHGLVTLSNRRMVKEEKERELARKRKERERGRKAESRDSHGESSDMSRDSHTPSSSPTPNLLLHSPKKKHIWPEGFALSESMKVYAANRGINAAAEFAAWQDDCAAHARAYVDWEAAWRTRINNAPRFADKRAAVPMVDQPKRKENYLDRINRW